MNKPKNWENVKAPGEYATLPVGGYICRIKDAKEKTYPGNDGSSFSKLEMAFDIEAGEYKGFYDNDFQMQQQEDKKWRGVLRYYLPKDDDSEKDGWTQSTLKGLIEALEDSNPGYHWDWNNPGSLKGRILGITFRNEEWFFDGRTGWKAQPFRGISVDAINKNRYKLPKDKPLSNRPASTGNDEFTPVLDDGDLPF